MTSEAVVVIATYNEAESIGGILDALRDLPVIVIDDHSPDGTMNIAVKYPNTDVVVRHNERGIATAYTYGLRRAVVCSNADYVVQMDAGGTHDPNDVVPMILAAKNWHADLVIGSRFSTLPHMASYRTAISLTAAWLMRRRGVDVQDATSGFRVWRRDLLYSVVRNNCRSRGFAFNLELLWRAHVLGATIREYPIEYRLTNSTFRIRMLWEAAVAVGRMR